MLDRRVLAREAVYRALSLRKRLSLGLEMAISPVDAAEQLMIDVRFVDIPSMEGIYAAGTEPRIILSCLRPLGRRNFTCAHEIGHHEFGHGQQFDEIVDHRSARRRIDPYEFSADCFASYFLMPKTAIELGMSRRGFQYGAITPFQAYSMSSWLGVGYRTFVNHLAYGLMALSRGQAEALLKIKPMELRSEIVGTRLENSLHIVDRSWCDRAVDCEVGDHLLVPRGTLIEGSALSHSNELVIGDLVRIVEPGLGRVSQGWPLWSAFVRASRRKYVGRSRYRFEEEAEEP